MNSTIRRSLVFVATVLSVVLIASVHFETGVAYEFQLFFLIPVVIAAWMGGSWMGSALALIATASWYAVDRAQHLTQATIAPALFNSITRFVVFILFVLAVHKIQAMIAREVAQAKTDALTGLLNRRGFQEEALRLQAFASRKHLPVAALFMDIDGFKGINDQLGHETGDHVLIKVASALREHARQVDLLCRLGGDEFVVLLLDITADDAQGYAASLQQLLLREMASNDWPATFSIGIACAANAAAFTMDALLESADQLMYQVKSAGKNGIRLVRL